MWFLSIYSSMLCDFFLFIPPCLLLFVFWVFFCFCFALNVSGCFLYIYFISLFYWIVYFTELLSSTVQSHFSSNCLLFVLSEFLALVYCLYIFIKFVQIVINYAMTCTYDLGLCFLTHSVVHFHAAFLFPPFFLQENIHTY